MTRQNPPISNSPFYMTEGFDFKMDLSLNCHTNWQLWSHISSSLVFTV